uniref:Uncharacterized protein n=1 Tax=Oryza sativa subsp. japonica TaxID=39947 RepID=Q8W341_ORYSJ|nr:hypothetical protein [Oryza sativa Japonica Group]
MAAIGALSAGSGASANHGGTSANNSCYSMPQTRARSGPRSLALEMMAMATRRRLRRSQSQPKTTSITPQINHNARPSS